MITINELQPQIFDYITQCFGTKSWCKEYTISAYELLNIELDPDVKVTIFKDIVALEFKGTFAEFERDNFSTLEYC